MISLNLIARVVILLSISLPCFAATCDFKGISVGDRIPKKEIFEKLGIKNYKLEPDMQVSEKDLATYGSLRSEEIAQWRVGPYCLQDTCNIPFGVKIEENIPSSVMFVYADNDLITDIRIKFNAKYWKTVFSVLRKKYGTNWERQKEFNFVMTDDASKKSVTVNRTMMRHRVGGVNQKTKSRCELYATDYDSIFLHQNALGAYQSIFGISLLY